LRSTKTALCNITNEKSTLTHKLKAAQENIRQLKCTNVLLEEKCVNLEVDLLETADAHVVEDGGDDNHDDGIIQPD
jgi:hypothetical protein